MYVCMYVFLFSDPGILHTFSFYDITTSIIVSKLVMGCIMIGNTCVKLGFDTNNHIFSDGTRNVSTFIYWFNSF